MQYTYEAIFEPEGEFYNVHFPDLDGCFTFGKGIEEAVYMASDLLQTWLSMLIEEGKPLPKATFNTSVPKGCKTAFVSIEAPVSEPETMSTSDAADILGVSQARVRAMIHDGILEARKVGRDNLLSAESVKRRANNPKKAGRPKIEAHKELVHA